MPKIGRPRAEVVVTDDERAELVRLMKRARVNRAVAFRARIVLACIDASDTAVAHRLRTTKTTVAKRRGQFVERRLEGLYDEPRGGAPCTIAGGAVLWLAAGENAQTGLAHEHLAAARRHPRVRR